MILFHFGELTRAAIAQLLGLTTATVKARLATARRMLREQLRELL